MIGLCFATKSVDLWRNLCASQLYFVVGVRCRRKESSRSLSHLLVSFFLLFAGIADLLYNTGNDDKFLRVSQ